MLPKGVSMDQVNAFLNSDLVPIISSIAKNPKDFDQDDAKAIITSEPVQKLLASQELKSSYRMVFPSKPFKKFSNGIFLMSSFL